MTDAQLWKLLREQLRISNADVQRHWFDEIEPLGIDNGVLYLRAHSVIHRDYLNRQCLQPFADAARAASGLLISCKFVGPGEDSGIAKRSAADVQPGTTARAAVIHQPVAEIGDDAGQTRSQRAAMSTEHAADSGAIDGNHLGDAEHAHTGHTGHHGHHGHDGPWNGSHEQSDGERIPSAAELAAEIASLDTHRPPAAAPHSISPAAHHSAPPEARHDHPPASRPSPFARPAAARPTHAGIPTQSGYMSYRHNYDDGLTFNPDYGFDSFVVGESNRLAHAAATAVARNPGRTYNPLFIYGDVGLGKTHLLQAICLSIKESHPDAVLYYCSCEGFTTQFTEAVQAGVMPAFRSKMRNVDVIVIDDIHLLSRKDRTQEEFFHTFNALYQNQRQIILSSDASPEEIPELEERLVSRFKCGLVVDVSAPGFETRESILKAKARIRGMTLPDDVANFIAGRIDANIRELEGAIIKLQVMSELERRPVDLALARKALGEGDGPRVEPKVQMQQIINVVTDYYGIKITDLQSKRRHRSIAQPRQLCMYLARRHTRFSLEEIGGHFGGRDHTTVMHAVRTIEEKCNKDSEFGRIVKVLEDRIRG